MPSLGTPQFLDEQLNTPYPFSSGVTLTNGEGYFIPDDLFLDAHLYPIGVSSGLHLSQVTLTSVAITLYLSDSVTDKIASASFPVLDAPELITFSDVYGRPAGVLVADPSRLNVLQSWALGDHFFETSASEFVAAVCTPSPEVGFRGFQLDDGTVLTGDIWLVGADGVVLRKETTVVPGAVGQPNRTYPVVRVDIVGDPLFRRRLCLGHALFTTPQLLKTITVHANGYGFLCGPDPRGDFKLTVGNNLAADTVLRVRTTPDGILLEAEGTTAA